MIALTGATGQLGQFVVEALLKTVPAKEIVAIVRNPAKAEALSKQGLIVRQGDYNDQAALTQALAGVENCCSSPAAKSASAPRSTAM